MKRIFALVLASLVLGCVTSYNSEISVGVNGSASFNKTIGGPTTTVKVVKGASSSTTVVVQERLMTGSTAKLGSFLVDSRGMTLYVFDKDESGKSSCYGDCAKLWPPLATPDDVFQGVGVEGVIGYASRTDGVSQVTYEGRPLYYYSGDKQPGDVKGDGVKGIWHVASATNQEAAPATSNPAAATQAPTTTVTAAPAGEVPATGIALSFTPDRETVPLSEKFYEDLLFTNLDSAKNYSVVLRMYSPGGYGDGGQDVNIAFADSFARENGILTYSFGMPITPFTHKADGYSSEMEFFTRKGLHHYDISVYDCTAAEKSAGKDNCGRGRYVGGGYENDDAWKGQEPVFHLDKVITVT